MIIVNVEEAPLIENPHGVDVRKLIGTMGVQISHVSLNPGEGLKGHKASENVFLYVLKGNGVVEVGDKKANVEAGSLVYIPKETPHAVTNQSNLEMAFLVIKVV